MARRAKAQRLITRINDARRVAGQDPISITPSTLTLQQVEAQADSLHITPEALLIESRGRVA
jgi:hypothetical protein